MCTISFLPPANEVCEGYVFTPVCQSFFSPGGGACLGPGPGGSRPRPGGGVGVSRPRPRKGCLGPGPRGCPGPGGVCIPACTEADTPQQTATAAGGTHLTECILVYSCGVLIYAFTNTRNLSNLQQGL